MKGLLKDERGIEPTAMKLLVGLILIGIGTAIGVGLYLSAGKGIEEAMAFSVSATPSSARVTRPTTGSENKTVSVNVERILGGYSEVVTLSCTGQPSGVTISFSPPSGVPSFGSTMTVMIDSTAPLGTHTITIRAKGADGKERTTTYTLEIE